MLNKMDKIHAFKEMLMVARHYKLEIEEKYDELDEEFLNSYDLGVTDMMGCLEHIYKELKQL